MLTRREDRIFEALLSQEVIEDEEFAELSTILATISREGEGARIDDRAGEFAEIAARMARSGEGGTTRRIRPGHRSLIPRLATAALAVILVVGMTGIAVAADAARPGDFLYGIDRAFERIGINDGGLGERIEEANGLVASGSPADALDHLADSVGSMSAGAADALQEAAANVRDAGDGATPDTPDHPAHLVRENVASMLEWMSDSDAEGRDFGQGIAERARNIAQAPPEPAGEPGPPADPTSDRGNGNGPTGGQPADQGGPPADRGGPPAGQSGSTPGPRGP